MEFLTDSFMSAFVLLWGLDQELLQIVYVSLKVSSISTLIASMIGIPAGFLIAFREFRGKRLLITVLNTLLALPTVVVGLFVYALFMPLFPGGGYLAHGTYSTPRRPWSSARLS
jgi:tungstate transport system permease protein